MVPPGSERKAGMATGRAGPAHRQKLWRSAPELPAPLGRGRLERRLRSVALLLTAVAVALQRANQFLLAHLGM